MDIEVISLIEKHGLKGTIIVIVLGIITTLVKSKWFGDLWTKIANKLLELIIKKEDNVYEISKSDITNHDIFTYIDFWVNSKIPTFQFSTEYRTFVFKKYIKIYLEKHKYEISEFIKSESYKDMDAPTLKKSLLDLLNKIVVEYEKKCEEVGIPKIIILKMKSRNNDMITLTMDLIESISDSPFYENPNNYLKLYSVLNIISSILENAISNSQSVCNSINGELKGQIFIDNETNKKYIEP